MKTLLLSAVFSVALLVPPVFVHHAEAAALTVGQVSAIVSLLQAFGADQSVINNVQAALGGTASTGTGGSSSSGPTASFTINGQTSAANVDPLLSRMWAWSSAGGSAYRASVVISGCDDSRQNGTTNPWTPWAFGSGTPANGSASPAPGAGYYGCMATATYTVTGTGGQQTIAQATVTFRHLGGGSTTPTCTTTPGSGGKTTNFMVNSGDFAGTWATVDALCSSVTSRLQGFGLGGHGITLNGESICAPGEVSPPYPLSSPDYKKPVAASTVCTTPPSGGATPTRSSSTWPNFPMTTWTGDQLIVYWESLPLQNGKEYARWMMAARVTWGRGWDVGSGAAPATDPELYKFLRYLTAARSANWFDAGSSDLNLSGQGYTFSYFTGKAGPLNGQYVVGDTSKGITTSVALTVTTPQTTDIVPRTLPDGRPYRPYTLQQGRTVAFSIPPSDSVAPFQAGTIYTNQQYEMSWSETPGNFDVSPRCRRIIGYPVGGENMQIGVSATYPDYGCPIKANTQYYFNVRALTSNNATPFTFWTG